MIDSRADQLEDAFPYEDRHGARARAWDEREYERELDDFAPAASMWHGRSSSPANHPAQGAADAVPATSTSGPEKRKRPGWQERMASASSSGGAGEFSDLAPASPTALSPAGGSSCPRRRV